MTEVWTSSVTSFEIISSIEEMPYWLFAFQFASVMVMKNLPASSRMSSLRPVSSPSMTVSGVSPPPFTFRRDEILFCSSATSVYHAPFEEG